MVIYRWIMKLHFKFGVFAIFIAFWEGILLSDSLRFYKFLFSKLDEVSWTESCKSLCRRALRSLLPLYGTEQLIVSFCFLRLSFFVLNVLVCHNLCYFRIFIFEFSKGLTCHLDLHSLKYWYCLSTHRMENCFWCLSFE